MVEATVSETWPNSSWRRKRREEGGREKIEREQRGREREKGEG